MDPIEKGKRNEERGLNALKELKNHHPDFILKIRRASPGVDGRGIDCFVEIRLPEGTSKADMTVPIEFKSSRSGFKKWKVKHKDLRKAGVLIFYFRDAMTPREVRRLMYRALKRVQLNSRDGTLYHGMFQRLFKGRRNEKLQKNIRLIRKLRSRETKR